MFLDDEDDVREYQVDKSFAKLCGQILEAASAGDLVEYYRLNHWLLWSHLINGRVRPECRDTCFNSLVRLERLAREAFTSEVMK
jgi:hypothetical protein